MKCVICGEEAEYVQFGMSICEKHFKAEPVGNRDVDLTKIQIYADRCHTFLTSRLSFLFVFFSLVGVFYGFYYQGLFAPNLLQAYTSLLIIGLVVIGFILLANRER